MRKIDAELGYGGGMPARTGNKVIDRVSMTLWAGGQARQWIDKGRTAYRQHTTWTVTVEESDRVYRNAQKWLLDNTPVTSHKNVIASTETIQLDASGMEVDTSDPNMWDDIVSSKSKSKTRITTSLGRHFSQNVKIDGYNVKVTFNPRGNEIEGADLLAKALSSSPRGSGRSGRARVQSFGPLNKIVFECRSLNAQTAVLEMLDKMVEGTGVPKPSLWVSDSWGSWRQQDAPVRKLSSVVLRDGLKDDIVGDLKKFLSDEQRYSELGIPWHRGYLFHGPAGTGKTSLIKAMAGELGLDLWYAPLGDLKDDSSLVDLIRSVRARGILLLEDVDAFSAARDRETSDGDNSPGISTSALLNALDGVVTPHGLITIMTTNHLDKLDTALVRSGRADVTVELGLPQWAEVQGLWSVFFPNEEPLGEEPEGFMDLGVSQASVSEVFKRGWDFPDQARSELYDMVKSGKKEVGVQM